ncbi:MAG: AAA family ATPase [Candidatus Eisenbacteria bacterium]
MKIAVTGKGGTGKTTVAGVLAHYFNNDGYRVLAVDADPDANLGSALGVPSEEVASIVPISAMRELIKERTGADPAKFGQMFKMNPTVDDIPEKYSIDFRGIRLLVLGAIQTGGGGCACAENVLVQSLLSEIVLNRDEVVIVDMEAGIEHLGRATLEAIDKMLIVVEPGMRSIATATTIMRLAGEIGVTSFGIIANKVKDAGQSKWIVSKLPAAEVIGMIPYSEMILNADREQHPLIDELDRSLKAEFLKIYEACR